MLTIKTSKIRKIIHWPNKALAITEPIRFSRREHVHELASKNSALLYSVLQGKLRML